MKTNKFRLPVLLLTLISAGFLIPGSVGQAGSTRIIEANQIKGLSTVNIVNGGGTLTLPSSTDTIVGRATTDTLTNKTLSGSSNTFSSIGYSSLSLTGSILNADISGSAAIARSKVAVGTADHVVINSGAGALSSEANLAISRGGTGAGTKAGGFDALSPMTTSGDIIYGGASGTGTRLAKGSNGDVLTLAAGIPSWAAPATTSAVAPTTYTPTFTGFGSVINVKFVYTYFNGVLTINGTFTAGTPTGVEARVSFPGSYTSNTNVASPSACGSYVKSQVDGNSGIILNEPNAAYLTFATQDAAHNGLTKINGNAAIGTSSVISLYATVITN